MVSFACYETDLRVQKGSYWSSTALQIIGQFLVVQVSAQFLAMLVSSIAAWIVTTLMLARSSTAKHVKLTWKPFNGHPSAHGYRTLCTARVQKSTVPKRLGKYMCDWATVALWNADGLPDETLEFREWLA